MTVRGLLSIVFLDLLLPAVVILNIYLYFYPLLYSCNFPRATPSTPAPFRLLALADPQIEGGNKLLKYVRPVRTSNDPPLSFIDWLNDEAGAASLTLRKYGKILDLWGNDLYLSHVYRTMKRHTYPTHITVLGDMVGSQWITEDEFQRRGRRFWDIFSDATAVTAADVVAGVADDPAAWKNKLIMLPGNHDVGYAGDITRARLQRYEKVYGPYNYKLSFHPPAPLGGGSEELQPELRIAVLNSLTLDTPILDSSLADDSYAFVDTLLKNKSLSAAQATVLLTHLPLYKRESVCVDGPEITYFLPENGGGIKSQNFVSETVSNLLKGWVFGFPGGNEAGSAAKSRGVVLTGHDHEGCQSVHYWDELHDRPRWNVTTHQQWTDSGMDGRGLESVKEITVRSMMGEFGGNVGLLSAWFDWENSEWKFSYATCSLGIQHLWWAVHVVNVIAALWGAVLGLWYGVDFLSPPTASTTTEKKKQ